METRARAFPSSLHRFPLAGASAGSTSPRKPQLEGSPLLALARPGAPASHLAPGAEGGTSGTYPGEGSVFLCICSRKHLALLPSLGRDL